MIRTILTVTLLVMILLSVSCADRRAGDPIAPPTGVKFTITDGTNSYVNIKLKGVWDGWTLHTMSKEGNVWTCTIFDIEPGTYEWGAIEDDGSEWGIWLIEGGNQTVVVDDNGTGEAAYNIPIPQGTVNVTFRVDMTGVEGVEEVHIAGSLNNWDPASPDGLLTDDDGDSIYEITLELEVNTAYNYKYTKTNSWGGEEWPGDPNRTVNVGTEDMVINPPDVFGVQP